MSNNVYTHNPTGARQFGASRQDIIPARRKRLCGEFVFFKNYLEKNLDKFLWININLILTIILSYNFLM